MAIDQTPASVGNDRADRRAEIAADEPIVPSYNRGALPVAKSSIPVAVRLRLALFGIAIGLAALAAATALAYFLSLALFGSSVLD